MDQYRELANHLKGFGNQPTFLHTGIVKSCDGHRCEVELGDITLPDVRLRASLAADNQELLIVPAVGSAVVVGSLSGDLADLVVLAVDRAERIVINGGQLGGLVNIASLTAKLNELIQHINTHTHTSAAAGSPTSTPTQPAKTFSQDDYEDKKVTH